MTGISARRRPPAFRRGFYRESEIAQASNRTAGTAGKTVVLFADTLTRWTEPGIPRAALRVLRGADAEALIVANGTPCRHQIADGTGRKALHLAQVLDLALAPDPASGR